MDALLGLQEPVGVLALDGDRGALDAGFVALLGLVDLDLEAATFEPAQVHAEEHLGPVLRLGAAGPWVDGQDGAALVEAAAEEAPLLATRELTLKGVDAADELVQQVVVDHAGGKPLAHELLGGLEVGKTGLEVLELLEALLEAGVLGGGLGRRLLVVPEVGGLHALLERGDVGGQLGRVKDSSAASPGGRRPP